MQSNLRGAFVLTLAALASAACDNSNRPEDSNSAKDLAADKAAANVALFFGSPTNLAGVHADIRKNKALFEDDSYGWGFRVTAVNLATKSQILSTTREKAAEVGPGGTLLWYFSGHGLENGAMFTEDEKMLQFREVAETIKSVRTTALKRLIVVIDNCFSGTNLSGSTAIIPQSARLRERTDVALLQEQLDDVINTLSAHSYAEGTLYEQALVMTASQPFEISLDSNTGGVFSEAWRATLVSMKGRRDATIGEMAQKTKDRTSRMSGGQHTPMFRAIPAEAIMKEPLFGAVSPSDGSGSSVPPVRSDRLFAALTEANALHVAAPMTTTSIALCRGTLAACWAKPATETNFSVSEKTIQGATIFKSASFTPVSGQDFVILAYGSSGRPIEATPIRFRGRDGR